MLLLVWRLQKRLDQCTDSYACFLQSMVSRVSEMDVEEGYGAVAAPQPAGELFADCLPRD